MANLTLLAITPSEMTGSQPRNMVFAQRFADAVLITPALSADQSSAFRGVLSPCESRGFAPVHRVRWTDKRLLQTQLNCMSLVLAIAHIFQVLKGIIGLAAVSVVDFHIFGTRPKEGSRNQFMDGVRLHDVIAAKFQNAIATTRERTDNFARSGIRDCLVSPDAAQTRNAVPRFIADNRSPFLNHYTVSLLPYYSQFAGACNHA